MVGKKIKEKTPKKEIIYKTPDTYNESVLHQKIPSDIRDSSKISFEPPPPKVDNKLYIPKKIVKKPSNKGIRDKGQYDSKIMNVPPPTSKQYPYKKQELRPSSEGAVPSKKELRHIRSKTPPKITEKKPVKSHQRQPPPSIKKEKGKSISPPPSKTIITKIPSSEGAITSKKDFRHIRSKTPPKITEKKPAKSHQRQPPPSIKKKKGKIINKTIPKVIRTKTPSEKRETPPPTFLNKIPKSKVKSKRPK